MLVDLCHRNDASRFLVTLILKKARVRISASTSLTSILLDSFGVIKCGLPIGINMVLFMIHPTYSDYCVAPHLNFENFRGAGSFRDGTGKFNVQPQFFN